MASDPPSLLPGCRPRLRVLGPWNSAAGAPWLEPVVDRTTGISATPCAAVCSVAQPRCVLGAVRSLGWQPPVNTYIPSNRTPPATGTARHARYAYATKQPLTLRSVGADPWIFSAMLALNAPTFAAAKQRYLRTISRSGAAHMGRQKGLFFYWARKKQCGKILVPPNQSPKPSSAKTTGDKRKKSTCLYAL
jgi:hypothetical protein